MCRMVIFSGECTRCGEAQTWTELSQELSCLEAKNNGCFGECSRGVLVEEHGFDQECQTCSEEDEGIGDLEEDEPPDDGIHAQGIKRDAAEEQEILSSERKKQRT